MNKFEWDNITDDPHGIIPIGFKKFGYEVVGFSAPGGIDVLLLMVKVKYSDYKENGHGCSTTLDYLTILRDYLSVADPETLRSSVRAFRRKKIEEWEKNESI
jgi:hypothetical protein